MNNKKFSGKIFIKKWEKQRVFPNEELCRFLGRNFKKNLEKSIILDIGCGTGNNIFSHFYIMVLIF